MTRTILKLVSVVPSRDTGDLGETLARRGTEVLEAAGASVVETATVTRWCSPVAPGQGVGEADEADPVSLVEAWFRTTANGGGLPGVGRVATADDVSGSFVSWVTERVHIPPRATPPDAVLRVAVIRRALDMTRDEFDRHWNGHHVPLVRANRPLFSAYVTNVIEDPEVEWDGIVEQWFSDSDQAALHVEQSLNDKPEVAADILRMVSHVIPYNTADASWRPPSFD